MDKLRTSRAVRRAVLALLFIVAAGYVSVLASRRAAENRVGASIAAQLRKQGGEQMVYVWPSVAPDTASILHRNGVATQQCIDPAVGTCFPQAYLYRAAHDGPFVITVRWQYSRDHHGVGGTRRFFGLFGWVRELKSETYIQ